MWLSLRWKKWSAPGITITGMSCGRAQSKTADRWLHHARHVVDIPELDRLYGELNKLAQLANQPITDESLDARMHQAIAVYQNRAWKTLLRL